MEAKNVPIVGRAVETATGILTQTASLGRWAVGEAVAAVDNRIEESAIRNLDEIVRADFESMLSAERALARVELSDSIISESVRNRAVGTIQVYVEHFVRFHERDNIEKVREYAEKIKEVMPYAGDYFSIEDLRLKNPICAEALRVRLGLPMNP